MRTTRRKLKRKTPFIIFCVLLLALLAAGCVLARDILFPPGSSEVDGTGPDGLAKDQRLNVLLLGIDARRGETMARTDTMILASVDPKSKQIALLSIPRDTRVNIPGHGWDKINSAALYGGPDLSMKVVSDLLGIPVKYYVLTNFSGFKDIVDALGGVTLDVEQRMYHEGDEEYGGAYGINLQKGVQRLDGEKALQYVRYRDYPMGDVDRTRAQQKFLAALAKEVLQPSTIPKLPKLVPEISRYVKTNLSVGDMYKLALASKNLEDGNILTQTLPGRPVNIAGGSYWGVDPLEARQTVARLFNGETVTNVVLDTPLSSQYLGPTGGKAAAQPKTENTPAVAQQNQQGQNKAIPPAKPGQGVKTGGSGSSFPTGSVVITPGGTGSGTGTGTSPDRPAAGTQSGTGTGTGKTGSSTGGSTGTSGASGSSGTSGTDGVNPSIPGATKTSTSTS